jgi:hypothetical protein
MRTSHDLIMCTEFTKPSSLISAVDLPDGIHNGGHTPNNPEKINILQP